MSTLPEIFQGAPMRFRQIAHMDIVTNRCAIGSPIGVLPKIDSAPLIPDAA